MTVRTLKDNQQVLLSEFGFPNVPSLYSPWKYFWLTQRVKYFGNRDPLLFTIAVTTGWLLILLFWPMITRDPIELGISYALSSVVYFVAIGILLIQVRHKINTKKPSGDLTRLIVTEARNRKCVESILEAQKRFLRGDVHFTIDRFLRSENRLGPVKLEEAQFLELFLTGVVKYQAGESKRIWTSGLYVDLAQQNDSLRNSYGNNTAHQLTQKIHKAFKRKNRLIDVSEALITHADTSQVLLLLSEVVDLVPDISKEDKETVLGLFAAYNITYNLFGTGITEMDADLISKFPDGSNQLQGLIDESFENAGLFHYSPQFVQKTDETRRKQRGGRDKNEIFKKVLKKTISFVEDKELPEIPK